MNASRFWTETSSELISRPPGKAAGRNKGGGGPFKTPGGGWGKGGKPSAPEASSASIEVTQVALSTTIGTQDITISGFGTPKAAVFWLSRADTANSIVTHALGSIGMADGTRQFVNMWFMDHGAATANTRRRAATNAIALLIRADTGAVSHKASFNSWITDGVRINVDTTDGVAKRLNVMLIGGADVSAHVNTITPAAIDSVVTATPGFEMSALITSYHPSAADDTNRATSHANMGIASWDGTTLRQACNRFRSVDSPTTMDNYGGIRADAIALFGNTNRMAVENVTATGFDVRSLEAGFTADVIGYLALAGVEAWAGVVDTPTTTGTASLGSASFTPTAAVMVANNITALNTADTSGGGGAFAFPAMAASQEFTVGCRDQDAAPTSDTRAYAFAKAGIFYDHAGTTIYDGNFTGFTSGAAQINFTTVPASARKWPVLLMA